MEQFVSHLTWGYLEGWGYWYGTDMYYFKIQQHCASVGLVLSIDWSSLTKAHIHCLQLQIPSCRWQSVLSIVFHILKSSGWVIRHVSVNTRSGWSICTAIKWLVERLWINIFVENGKWWWLKVQPSTFSKFINFQYSEVLNNRVGRHWSWSNNTHSSSQGASLSSKWCMQAARTNWSKQQNSLRSFIFLSI